jgi:hypothetical protein
MDLSSAKKKYRTPFAAAEPLSAPGSIQKVRMPRRIGTDPLFHAQAEHGVRAASQRFHCEAKTLYNLIHRQGYTHYAKDLLSLRQICSHFGVRYSKVMSWIEQGLLQAKREQTRTGRSIYSIEFVALQKFCKEHRSLLITRRWPPQRIKFPEEYVFAPKHAELLRTRESKRENEAFDRGEYLDPDENFQRRA